MTYSIRCITKHRNYVVKGFINLATAKRIVPQYTEEKDWLLIEVFSLDHGTNLETVYLTVKR